MNLKELKQKMPDIFETVKNDVIKVLGWEYHRAGLRLGLSEMGMYGGGFIGGMHFHPGTDIVMNIAPLREIIKTKKDDIIWAYIYHILLHEYIHSLGELDELKVKTIAYNISEKVFKDENHPALKIAKYGIGVVIPNLQIIFIPPDRRPEGLYIEYVDGFDRESQSYYS